MKPETQLLKAAAAAKFELQIFLDHCGADEIKQSYMSMDSAVTRLDKAIARFNTEQKAKADSEIEITLLQCPCCGGNAVFECFHRPTAEYVVRCSKCDLNAAPDTKVNVAASWNRRAQ